MYTTYHFKSAADINIDILNAIKTAFKEKPIVVTIEEEMDTNKSKLYSNLQTAANEVKLHKQGKIKLKTAQQLLNEL